MTHVCNGCGRQDLGSGPTWPSTSARDVPFVFCLGCWDKMTASLREPAASYGDLKRKLEDSEHYRTTLAASNKELRAENERLRMQSVQEYNITFDGHRVETIREYLREVLSMLGRKAKKRNAERIAEIVEEEELEL